MKRQKPQRRVTQRRLNGRPYIPQSTAGKDLRLWETTVSVKAVRANLPPHSPSQAAPQGGTGVNQESWVIHSYHKVDVFFTIESRRQAEES